MLKYDAKLLEIKSIEKASNKTLLYANLYFEEHVDFSLEVDEFTGENLKNIIKDTGNYKYRLSLNFYFDKNRQLHYYKITRTYLNNSDTTSFYCSKEFVDKMSQIRGISRISDLDKLEFINRDQKKIDVVKKTIEDEVIKDEVIEGEKVIKISRYRTTKLVLVVVIIIIVMTFISSMSYPENSNPPYIEIDSAVVSSIKEGNIALTFDGGPSLYTKEIAKILKKYEVGGTFFFVGTNVKKYPKIVKYIDRSGYSVGSLAISQALLPELSLESKEYEVFESFKWINQITQNEIRLFRPPYGAFDKQIEDLLAINSYQLTLWNVDAKHLRSKSSDKIFDYITKSQLSGSILRLYESQSVVDALPRIIEYLQELQLEVVNLK